jgi:hypothetical protein
MANKIIPAIQTNEGNVGIGTIAPSGKLSVDFAGVSAFNVCDSLSSNVRVTVGTVNIAAFTYGLIQTYQHNSDTAGVSPLNIQPFGGNIGIGRTNPTYKLDLSLGTISTNTNSFGYNVSGDATTNIGFCGYNFQLNNSTANASAYMRLARTSATVYLGLEIASQSRDGIRFLTNATTPVEVLRIDTLGDVGIGTSNPGALVNSDATYFRPNPSAKFLDLYSDTNEADINLISNNSGDGSGIGGIYFTRARAQTDAHLQVAAIKAIQVGTGGTIAGGKLYFYTKDNGAGNTEASPQMVINADGNVGIGITNATAKLHVSGAGATFMRLDSNTLTSVAQFQAKANTDGVLIAGMYGPNPVAGTIFGANTSGAAFLGTTTLAAVHPTLLAIGTSNTIPIIFGTNSAERMRIAGAGNVGIGATSPAAKLDVVGNVLINGASNSNVAQLVFTRSDVSWGIFNETDLRFYSSNSNTTSPSTFRMTLTSAGNVGIGTANPVTLLHVDTAGTDARIRVSAGTNTVQGGMIANSSTSLVYAGSVTNHGFSLRTNDTDRVRIDTNGNVGIGVTNPRVLLDLAKANNVAQVLLLGEVGANIRVGFGLAPANAVMRIFSLNHITDGGIEFGGISSSDGSTWTRNHRLGLAAGNSFFNEQGGNVGIGTTNPVGKLTVQGNIEVNYNSTTADTSVRRSFLTAHSGINRGANITFGLLDGGSVAAGMTVYNTAAAAGAYNSQFIVFNTHEGGVNEGERMRITSLGNVGIGTFTPLSLLTVGTAGSTTAANGLSFGGDASANLYRSAASTIKTDGSLTVVGGASFGGNVGIGLTNPDLRLHIDAPNAYPAAAGANTSGFLTLRAKTAGASHGMYMGVADASPFGSWIQCGDSVYSAINYPLLLNPNGGNVGIGLRNPATSLDIAGSLRVTGVGQIGPVGGYGIALFNVGTNTFIGQLYGRASGIQFTDAAGGNTVYIANGGNVGIGSTNPSTNLHIGGTAASAGAAGSLGVFLSRGVATNFFEAFDGTKSFIAGVDNTQTFAKVGTLTNHPVSITQNNGSAIYIDTSKNVGIGTTNPASLLHVGASSTPTATATPTAIQLDNTYRNAVGGNTSLKIYLYKNGGETYGFGLNNAGGIEYHVGLSGGTAANHAFYTETTEKMRITSTGNVGIGITNPTAKLQVVQSNAGGVAAILLSSDESTIQGPSANTQIRMGSNLVLNGSNILTLGTNNVTRMVIDVTGNVGIGTVAPTAQNNYKFLQVNGTTAAIIEAMVNNVRIGGIDSDSSSLYFGSIGSFPIVFRTAVVEKMRITAAGLVGIGTATPTTLLSVGGAGSVGPASGLTFGGDAQANLYRVSEDIIKTDATLQVAGNFDGLGTVQAIGSILHRSTIRVLNKAATDWVTWFTRDTSESETIGRLDNIRSINGSVAGNLGIGTTLPSGKLHVVSTVAGATVLRTDGTNGTLFSVVDDLSDSLMSVNNSAGLPVLEVFADDRVVAGQYGSGDFVLINNKVGLGTSNPANKLSVIGGASIGSTTYNTSAPSNGLIVQGNVGIGSTNPDAKLQVNGEIRIASSSSYFTHLNYLDGGSNLISSTNGGSTLFRGSSNNLTSMVVYGDGTVSTNYNTYLAITSGNVGIGTTSSTYKLRVNGGQFGTLLKGGDLGAGSDILRMLKSDDSVAMIVRGDGLVGIGTASPSTKLEVGYFLDAFTNKITVSCRYENQPEFNFKLGQAGTNFDWIGGVISCGDDGNYNGIINFKTANAGRDTPTTKMVIRANGNVGVGLTTPAYKFEVSGGDVNIAGANVLRFGTVAVLNTINDPQDIYANIRVIRNASTANTDGMFIGYNNGGAGAGHLRFYANGAIERMRIQANDGHVGIGTDTAAGRLDVYNDTNGEHVLSVRNNNSGVNAYSAIVLRRNSNTNGLVMFTNSSNRTTDGGAGNSTIRTDNGKLLVGAGATTYHSFETNGNVGIGLTNPAAARLHIKGDGSSPVLRVESALLVAGTTTASKTFVGWMPMQTGAANPGDTVFIPLFK